MCLSEVTSKLRRAVARPGEYVIRSGDEGNCMFFVGSTPQARVQYIVL